MKKILFLSVVTAFLISCNSNKKENYISNEVSLAEITQQNVIQHPGKKLLESKCYACHSPSAGHDGRLAPPMIAVKTHYLTDDTSKEEFSDAIWNFVQKPSEYKSKMRGAVGRFGVMPYQEFSEDDIRLISEYIFENNIEEPEWFEDHMNEKGHGKKKRRRGTKTE